MDLENKVVLITGSSIGIGKETAFKLAKEKCRLIITYYKDEKEGRLTLKKCQTLGAKEAILLHLNVMDDESIKSCIRETIRKFKHIDILINNAGIFYWKDLSEHTYQEIDEQLKTNLEGLIKITKDSLPYIKELIINISSISGLKGYGKLTVYCATKFAVRGFSQALAQELPNLKVICINPGPYGTRMNDFEGTPPEIAAEKILNVIRGKYNLSSGDEVTI